MIRRPIAYLERDRPSLMRSGLEFLGHMLGSAVLFAAIAGIAWGLGYWVSYLHAKHNFPEVVYQGLHFVEYFLFGVDVILLVYLVIVGAIRFMADMRHQHR